MNCELAHERIVTAAYGELPDEQIHELERHVTGCPACQTEREQLLALKILADAHPVLEPPANLMARSRLRLRTIGEMLSTTEETAKNTLFRATKKLRTHLAELR